MRANRTVETNELILCDRLRVPPEASSFLKKPVVWFVKYPMIEMINVLIKKYTVVNSIESS